MSKIEDKAPDVLMPVALEYETPETFLAQILGQVQGQVVAVFMGKTTQRVLALEGWLQAVEAASSRLIWISAIEANPSYESIAKALGALGEEPIAVICAIGGGSAMDTAKVCVALDYLRDEGPVSPEAVLAAIVQGDYLAHPSQITLLVAPTTAGTGSEVTKWATIWHPSGQAKYSVDAQWLYPAKAYLVAEFMVTMPAMLTLSTGLDALCHACEAYWAKASNPMVKELTKAAVGAIVTYLPKALAQPDYLPWREKMLTAATLSGLAFAQTRTTACHAISYPLTGLYQMPHGLACAITLPGVMAINLAKDETIGELLEAMGFRDTKGLQEWLEAICRPYVTFNLSGFGIKEVDLNPLVARCFTKGRMDNNPVDLTKEQVYEILMQVI